MRIVSLVPSSTETLLALGADVVACTRFCEQPDLPHVGGTKNPDIAAVVELHPDLVVLDREENRVEDHDALIAGGLDVFVSAVTDLDSALSVVSRLSEAAGLRRSSAPSPPLPVRIEGPRRRAFVPIWRRPWMTIASATYGASLLAHIGIDVAAVGGKGDYPTVELDDVAATRPELVIVPSEPYTFEARHLDELSAEMPHSELVEVDGQDLFWWGIRTPAAIARLSSALGPRPMP